MSRKRTKVRRRPHRREQEYRPGVRPDVWLAAILASDAPAEVKALAPAIAKYATTEGHVGIRGRRRKVSQYRLEIPEEVIGDVEGSKVRMA